MSLKIQNPNTMTQTEEKPRLQVKMNRVKSTTGICRLSYSNPLTFKEWRVCLNKKTGMVFAEFTMQNNSSKYSTPWTTNPLSLTMRDEIIFDNENDWKIFEEECDVAFKYQIRKFPENYQQQIKDSLNDLEWSKGRIKITDKTYTQIDFIKTIINSN